MNHEIHEAHEKAETLAEIVAALRHNSKGLMFYFHKNETGSTHAMGADYADLADRIEAAAKRERAEIEANALAVGGIVEASRKALAPKPDPDWRDICAKCMDGEIDPDCEYYGEPNGCNSPIYGEHTKSAPVGDAAAMREVVMALAAVILPPRDKAGEGGWLAWVRAMQGKSRAALAAPPRNCDVGTAEEQAERFNAFCDVELREHCRNCRLCNAVDCELAWAQMPCDEPDTTK